jgi:hypothetical protein
LIPDIFSLSAPSQYNPDNREVNYILPHPSCTHWILLELALNSHAMVVTLFLPKTASVIANMLLARLLVMPKAGIASKSGARYQSQPPVGRTPWSAGDPLVTHLALDPRYSFASRTKPARTGFSSM